MTDILYDLRINLIQKKFSFRSAQTEEYVVYGPINREPEEKLYPWKYERKESGVRKLYALLYKKLQKK